MTSRKRVQPPRQVVREFYQQAQPRLQFPVLSFDEQQIAVVGAAFAEVIETRYTCYAAAFMPDHVHLVIRRHRDRSEEMAARLQAKSRLRLLDQGDIDPAHPIWIDSPGWQVSLEAPSDVRRTIAYVERNPRTPQHWPFVTPTTTGPVTNACADRCDLSSTRRPACGFANSAGVQCRVAW